MGRIAASESDIGVGMGSAYGTARTLSTTNVGKCLHAGQFKLSTSFGEFSPRDIGFDLFVNEIRRLGIEVGVSIQCDMSASGQWLQVLAAFLGSSTASPVETTASQGDYTHVMDMTSNNRGRYMTASLKVEDDYAIEIPSITWDSIGIDYDINGVGTFTATGIGSGITDNASVINTVSVLNALTYPSYDPMVFGTTFPNHYFRMNAQGGAGLTSGNNYQISKMSLKMSREMERRFVARGALSGNTLEPDQLRLSKASLAVSFTEISNANLPGFTEWLNQTSKKAEFFVDGAPIGTGLNRSLKLQFPKIYPSKDMPDGYGIDSNASLMQPTYMYDLIQATSAPTGMTGVLNYMRATAINNRAQSYFN